MDLKKTGTENQWSRKEEYGSRDQTGTGAVGRGLECLPGLWSGSEERQKTAMDEETPSLQGTTLGKDKG